MPPVGDFDFRHHIASHQHFTIPSSPESHFRIRIQIFLRGSSLEDEIFFSSAVKPTSSRTLNAFGPILIPAPISSRQLDLRREPPYIEMPVRRHPIPLDVHISDQWIAQ